MKTDVGFEISDLVNLTIGIYDDFSPNMRVSSSHGPPLPRLRNAIFVDEMKFVSVFGYKYEKFHANGILMEVSSSWGVFYNNWIE